MANRKPRSDAKLLNLSNVEQVEIYKRLKRDGYIPTRNWLKAEKGITTSTGALSNAHKHWAEEESEARIMRSKIEANNILSTLGAGEADSLTAAYDLSLKQTVFDMLMAGTADLDAVGKLATIVDRRAKQRLDERRIEQTEQALELKVRQYEDQIATALKAAESAERGGGLTPEALKEIKTALRM